MRTPQKRKLHKKEYLSFIRFVDFLFHKANRKVRNLFYMIYLEIFLFVLKLIYFIKFQPILHKTHRNKIIRYIGQHQSIQLSISIIINKITSVVFTFKSNL